MCVESREAVPLQEDSERLGGRDQSGTVQAGGMGLLYHIFRSLALHFCVSLHSRDEKTVHICRIFCAPWSIDLLTRCLLYLAKLFL